MARGFGATNGTGSADRIQCGYSTGITGDMTLSFWVWRTGSGGGGFGRVFAQDDATNPGLFNFQQDNTAGRYYFLSPWSTQGVWYFTAPATGAYNHVLATYNVSSSSNNPTIYLNGTSQSLTEEQSPSGSLVTLTGNYYIGNRADLTRNWNGKIGEFALWNGTILTAQNIADLAAGLPPLSISPSSLSFYAPLWGDEVIDQGPAHTTLTATGALTTDDPAVRRPFFPIAGGKGSSAGEYNGRLVA